MWKKEKKRWDRRVLINSFPQRSAFSPLHYAKYLLSYMQDFFIFVSFFFFLTMIQCHYILALQHKKKCFILFASLGSHMRPCQLQVCSVYLKKKGRKKLKISLRYVNQKQCTGWNSKFRRILLMSVETESFCGPIFFITFRKDYIYVEAQPCLAITLKSNCAV